MITGEAEVLRTARTSMAQVRPRIILVKALASRRSNRPRRKARLVERTNMILKLRARTVVMRIWTLEATNRVQA